MTDDFMRMDLITRFVCYECGSLLNISYDPPKIKESASIWQSGDPTGAAVRYNKITIHPCANCLKPVTKMQEAVKTLLDGGLK